MKFDASVHYGDWKGTVAADDVDQIPKALLASISPQDGEVLLGVRMHAGESRSGLPHKDVQVEFLFATTGGYATIPARIAATEGPLPVRSVKQDMPIADFLAVFKRFEVSLSRYGALSGIDYQGSGKT